MGEQDTKQTKTEMVLMAVVSGISFGLSIPILMY